MDLKAARIVLRPRKPSEIFDLALRFTFDADRRVFLWLSLTMLLPAWIGCIALRYALGLHWGWVWTIAFLTSQLLQGPFSVAAGRLMFEPRLTVREVVRHFRERFGAFLLATFLRLAVIGAAACAVVIPAFIAAHRFLYVNEAVLLERATGGEALRRSSRFVQGYGSHGITMVLGLSIAFTSFVVTFETLGQSLTNFVLQVGEPFGTLWSNGGSPFALLGLFLSVPYFATARFLAYVDQRTRQDGWDVQVKFMSIQASESGHGPQASAPGGRAA